VKTSTPAFTASDGRALRVYQWERAAASAPRAVILIAHGMGEHAARYAWVAERLCDAGYPVYALDQRGHGRTAPGPADLGDMGPDGWNRGVRDLRELIDWIGARHLNTPRVLLGHSMGSLLARQYLIDHGDTLDAAVLSGSTDGGGLQLRVTRLLARVERWRHGSGGESAIIQKALFGRSNRNFDPGRTGFEWLSRDPEQVDLYMHDAHCGFVLRMGSLCDMFEGLVVERRRSERAKIPKRLPIFVFSGDADPIHQKLKGLRRLLDEYEAVGLERVDHKFYPGGRHEMFNETNREEVCSDLIDWLHRSVPAVNTATSG
jgi:alpha-beta hydrolase superfamily lysophospholipase